MYISRQGWQMALTGICVVVVLLSLTRPERYLPLEAVWVIVALVILSVFALGQLGRRNRARWRVEELQQKDQIKGADLPAALADPEGYLARLTATYEAKLPMTAAVRQCLLSRAQDRRAYRSGRTIWAFVKRLAFALALWVGAAIMVFMALLAGESAQSFMFAAGAMVVIGLAVIVYAGVQLAGLSPEGQLLRQAAGLPSYVCTRGNVNLDWQQTAARVHVSVVDFVGFAEDGQAFEVQLLTHIPLGTVAHAGDLVLAVWDETGQHLYQDPRLAGGLPRPASATPPSEPAPALPGLRDWQPTVVDENPTGH